MTERPRLDLTATKLEPLEIESPYEAGKKLVFGFKRLLDRQARQTMQRTVGKGKKSIDTVDWARMFRATIAYIHGLPKGKGIPSDGKLAVGTDDHAELIEKVMIAPPPGGFPEEVVEQVVEHLFGTNILSDEEGNA